MKSLSGVVWHEGMHLGSHHFQAQNRYFEDLVDFAVSSLGFEPYGLSGYEVDEEAIRNGTLSLVSARGIFPDGLPFTMPDSDPLPPARNISEAFPAIRTSLDVWLAIQPRKADAANLEMDELSSAQSTRYVAKTLKLTDEETGRDQKPVRIGHKNIFMLLDTEEAEGLVRMPLARIVRDGAGQFAYDPDLIPPLLKITAHAGLNRKLEKLIQLLEEKSLTLAPQAGVDPGTGAGFSAREISHAWLLHSINCGLASLRHLLLARHPHPEGLFVELSRLAGALCTFGLESHPSQLPLYDHLQLAECFQALDEHIREHLKRILPTNFVTIPLNPVEDYYYRGQVSDQRVLGSSLWIMAIRCPIGEAQLIKRTPELLKICSHRFIRRLVQRALPASNLRHLSTPPAAISPKVDWHYFRIDKSGPCWDDIVKTRQLGVYIPGELPQAQVEIMVVLES